MDSLKRPIYGDWHEAVAQAVWASGDTYGRAEDSLRADLDSLWHLDSVAVRWALADLIADDFHYNDVLASRAAAFYVAFELDPITLLARSQVQGTGPTRWATLLEALRPPLSDAAQEVLMEFVCGAMPLLLAAPREDPSSLFADFYYRLGEGLDESTRLLVDPARSEVRRLLVDRGYASAEP